MADAKYFNVDGTFNWIDDGKPTLLVADDLTLTPAMSGKTFTIATDAKTFTLPATVEGVRYTFRNTGAAGNNIITISPNAADGIYGSVTLAASVVTGAGTADKDLILTKATSVLGELVTIVGDGDLGWWIEGSQGIFEFES